MTDKNVLRVRDYLQHISAAIERIETYVQGLDFAKHETLDHDAFA